MACDASSVATPVRSRARAANSRVIGATAPMDRFTPRPSLASGHRMTLYSWGNPRYFPRLPAPVRRYFDVADGTRVAADCHWQPQRHDRATVIALHGLNGSSDAHYMRGLAAKAFERGLNVVRLNQRNCGDTERLSV